MHAGQQAAARKNLWPTISSLSSVAASTSQPTFGIHSYSQNLSSAMLIVLCIGLVSDHRAEWINVQTRARENEYTDYEPCRVFIGTWNLGGALPDQSLRIWLLENSTKKKEDKASETPTAVPSHPSSALPDVYVLGFQEADTSKEAFLYHDSSREEQLLRNIATAFGPELTDHYQRVASRQLIGMLIIVLIKDTWRERLKFVQTGSVGCGIMGLMGNKGAVAVRLGIGGSVITFVNSHLAADMLQMERRNQDFHEIVRRLRFTTASINSPTSPPLSASNATLLEDKFLVDAHTEHYIYQTGVLNAEVAVSDGEARLLIGENQLERLLQRDQLRTIINSKKAFADFKEPQITFRPTYKFNVGGSLYDTSEKRRVPAWCDRILHYTQNQYVENYAYTSHEVYYSSDHKPVSGRYQIHIKKIDPARYRQVYDDVNKQMDRIENNMLPEVALSTNQLIFDPAKFMKRQTLALDVSNIGKVSTTFNFLAKDNTGQAAPSWLWISPQRGSIPPGQLTTIMFTIDIDARCAMQLNRNADSNLNDIVILELENGRHFFIMVDATYMATCFARTLEELSSRTTPVRATALPLNVTLPSVVQSNSFTNLNFDTPSSYTTSTEQLEENNSVPLLDADMKTGASPIVASLQAEHMSIPHELWRLADAIIQYTVANPHTNFNPFANDTEVDPTVVEYVVECLDTGMEFDKSKLGMSGLEGVDQSTDSSSPVNLGMSAIGRALVLFLECLEMPVVPYDYQQPLLRALGNKMDICTIIGTLPTVHRASMNYLTAMLQTLVYTQAAGEQRHLYLDLLCNTFGSIILRPPASSIPQTDNTRQNRKSPPPPLSAEVSLNAIGPSSAIATLPSLPLASQSRQKQPPPLPPRNNSLTNAGSSTRSASRRNSDILRVRIELMRQLIDNEFTTM